MEQKKEFIINTIYYAVIIVMGYRLIRDVIPLIRPFLLAFCLAWGLRRPARWISAKTGLKSSKGILLLFTTLFFIGITVLLLTVGIYAALSLKTLFLNIPDMYHATLLPALEAVFHEVEGLVSRFEPKIGVNFKETFQQFIGTLGQSISKVSVDVIKVITNFLTTLPSFFVRLVMMVIASFYFSADFERVTAFLLRLFPKHRRDDVIKTKNQVLNVCGMYAKSYLIILTITFVELLIGLSLLGVRYVGIIAFCIALFDILPALGTGGILIPWGIILAFAGNYTQSVGILLLYVIISAIRNVIEPKIIGKQMGLHPLATLIGMFLGVHVFGIIGMFIVPIGLSVMIRIKDNS